MYYKGNYKCREPACGHQTRSLLLKQKCMVAGCKGRVSAQTSELQVNDTLRYLQGLFNVEKFLNELHLTKRAGDKENVDLKNIPHRDVLNHVVRYIDSVLEKSKYNKVDLKEIFSFMIV